MELKDFAGRPLGFELPMMIARENTNTPVNGEFTTMPASGVTPRIPIGSASGPLLADGETDTIVEIGFGVENFQSYIRDDDDIEDDEFVTYLMDTPLTYDGPLSFGGSPSDIAAQAFSKMAEVTNARLHDRSGNPRLAALEMWAEIDLALRAALGVYADLSLTARNAAEAALMLAYQNKPTNALSLPQNVPYTPSPLYAHAVQDFFDNNVAGDNFSHFVGPDGAVYEDTNYSFGGGVPANPMWHAGEDLKSLDQLMAHAQKMLEEERTQPPSDLLSRLLAAIEERLGKLDQNLEKLGQLVCPVPQPSSPDPFGDFIVAQRFGTVRGIASAIARGAINRGRATVRLVQQRITQRTGPVNSTQITAKFIAKTRVKLRLLGARVKFNYDHVFRADPSVPRASGVGGAHADPQFRIKLNLEAGRILDTVNHPIIRGIQTHYYQIGSRYANGPQANQLDGGYKNKIYTKTTYDPAIISDQTMALWGRQAFRNVLIRTNGAPPEHWVGVTSSGVRIEGTFNPSTRTVTTFFVKM